METVISAPPKVHFSNTGILSSTVCPKMVTPGSLNITMFVSSHSRTTRWSHYSLSFQGFDNLSLFTPDSLQSWVGVVRVQDQGKSFYQPHGWVATCCPLPYRVPTPLSNGLDVSVPATQIIITSIRCQLLKYYCKFALNCLWFKIVKFYWRIFGWCGC